MLWRSEKWEPVIQSAPPILTAPFLVHCHDLCGIPGVSNLLPVGRTPPRMAMNAAQHKIVNLLKTLWDFFVITCHNVFNVWPRGAKRLDTPTVDHYCLKSKGRASHLRTYNTVYSRYLKTFELMGKWMDWDRQYCMRLCPWSFIMLLLCACWIFLLRSLKYREKISMDEIWVLLEWRVKVKGLTSEVTWPTLAHVLGCHWQPSQREFSLCLT